ncbi:MAG TPA: lysylphosphatidylglycerol synthase transmembrane domain-containing protein [Candidatus Dormibacteraeota bacterium]|jgi:uncharacterized membrane protein YbhN (UPF0104 family)|nr:lysylphosphatidylglycerol synthase transmembrane domain-containing protein [Candidatus Dormibacteraeota bacterium]
MTWRALREVGRRLRAHWLLVLGLGALGGLVVAVDPARLVRALADADRGLLALMLPCVLAHYVFRSLAWRVGLRRIGVRVGVVRAAVLTLAAQSLVFLPGGDLWRVPVLTRMEGSRRDQGELASTVVFDDLVFWLLLTLALIPALLGTPELGMVVVGILLGEAAIVALLLWPAGYAFAVEVAGRVPAVRHLRPQLRQLGPAFRRLANPRTLAATALLDAVAALLAFGLFRLALMAVHVREVDFVEAAFVYALGHLFAGLSMLPAGLGVYEGTLTGLLVLQGVDPASAAAAALLYRGFNDLLMGMAGLPVVMVLDRARPGSSRPGVGREAAREVRPAADGGRGRTVP